MTSLIVVVLLVWGAACSESAAEQCKGSENTDAVEADLSRLRGKWYEYSSFGMLPVAGPRLCHSAHFYPSDDGSCLACVNDFVHFMNGNPNHITFRWNVTKDDPDDKTKLTVALSLQMVEWTQATFRVIDTDYINFIIISLCKYVDQRFNLNARMVLTKQQIADNDARKRIAAAFRTKKLSHGKFIQTPQADCEDVTFPESVADLGLRDPRFLPSKGTSDRAKLYDYIPMPPFENISARKSDN